MGNPLAGLVALALVGVGSAGAQTPPPPRVAVPAVAPRPADVASIDGMIRAWYDIVSGPAGQPRDWGRDRSLYIPDIRFVTAGQEKGRAYARIRDHQGYVDEADAELRQGFFEKEIHRVTQRFGPIAHVWSTYESRATEKGPVIARGINSIELFWDGQRWWIANGNWTEETKEQPIPATYLPPSK